MTGGHPPRESPLSARRTGDAERMDEDAEDSSDGLGVLRTNQSTSSTPTSWDTKTPRIPSGVTGKGDVEEVLTTIRVTTAVLDNLVETVLTHSSFIPKKGETLGSYGRGDEEIDLEKVV